MLNKKNTLGFTLVELVVVATILVILTSIGFYSYVGNLQDSRDSARTSDIAKLTSALTLYKTKRSVFPNPGASFTITNDGNSVAIQGKMDQSVSLSTMDTLVYDPKNKLPYSYSITTNEQEFQVAGSLENADNPKAILQGSYSPVSVNILPTLILASDSTSDLEIADTVGLGTTNRQLFIFNGGNHNIPYDFIDGQAQSDGTAFADLMNDPLIEFWQNSDYRSCDEILEAGKSIGDGEYQILDSTGTLSGEICTGM